jgi:thiamine kinase-like enzyme
MGLAEWEQRLSENKQVTLVHGDCHFGNFAMPKQPEGAIYLQDWALWHRNIPAYDLSYMLSRCLPEYRKRVEIEALKHYHTQLSIGTYSWDHSGAIIASP